MSSGTNDTNGILQPSLSNGVIDYFDIDSVQIVNIHNDSLGFPRCDVNIGRKWKESYGVVPLAGVDGPFGNPFVLDRDGDRDEVLAKYKEWLYRGTEVVNGYDPKEVQTQGH